MATVGVIVNPLAGKDIRRLVTNASPVSDASKIGMVRRAVVGAIEGGATRVLLSDDHHHLCRRAVHDLDAGGASIEVLDEPLSGDRLDTVAAAARMAKEDAGAVVVFGGDGTHRDVAAGWPEVMVVPVSTGTNNVFPLAWDATSAGTAAGLVASGAVDADHVTRRAKRLDVHVVRRGGVPPVDDVALVDVALVAGAFVGARAVWDARRIRSVVACIATPASSGLSSIAGRAHPVDRWAPGGAVVHLGPGGRQVRLPLSPGTFATVGIASTASIAAGDTVTLAGPGVLTFDGERTHVLHDGDVARVTLRADGPSVIDVERALWGAVDAHRFDVEPVDDVPDPEQETPRGD